MTPTPNQLAEAAGIVSKFDCISDCEMSAADKSWLRRNFSAALVAAFERGREEAALKVEEQGRLLKAIFETSGYDALIGDLARAIRARKTEGATDEEK